MVVVEHGQPVHGRRGNVEEVGALGKAVDINGEYHSDEQPDENLAERLKIKGRAFANGEDREPDQPCVIEEILIGSDVGERASDRRDQKRSEPAEKRRRDHKQE